MIILAHALVTIWRIILKFDLPTSWLFPNFLLMALVALCLSPPRIRLLARL